MSIKRHLVSIALIGIVFVLFVTNLTPNTYLTGWDNLQTELNPVLGIKRAFFAAWQEYQSFGLAAGMAHGADLLRAIGVYLASFILPQELIRYSFHLLMLLIGGLGMVRLLSFVLNEKHKKTASFLGAAFYMLNFVTIQMFFLPFEPFSAFFAFLPWLVWAFVNLTSGQPTRRDWLFFFVINLLATPAFVLQQQFVVYGIALSVLATTLFLRHPTKTLFKRIALAGVVVLAINGFWLLPQAYFLKTDGSVVREAKINQLATDDVFYSNKDKGTLTDFLTMTSFLTTREDQYQRPLFAFWNAHRLSLLGIISLGVVTAIWLFGITRPSQLQIPFVILFGIVSIALLANTQPFAFVNDLLRGNSLINQIFRSPFTKFSMLYALLASYFFAVGAASLLSLSHKLRWKNMLTCMVALILAASVFVQGLPAFTGQLFSPVMKASIPSSYQDAFSYFKTVDTNKRIALLPDYTFWGWFYHDWGYNGSGFVWYGIEQPIISRTFDVWSLTSESYFWEQKQALEKEDLESYEAVLEKYQVDYLLFDESLLPVVSTAKSMQQDRIKTLLAKSTKIKQVKRWDRLTLYEVRSNTRSEAFLSSVQALPNIGPSVPLTNQDAAFANNGLYQTNTESLFDHYYPFLGLTTQTQAANPTWNIHEAENAIQVTSTLPFDADSYALSTASGEMQFVTSENGETLTKTIPYTVEKMKRQIQVSFPKVQAATFSAEAAVIKSCSESGITGHSTHKKELLLTAENGGSTCVSFPAPTLSQNYGYLLRVDYENKSGQPLFFYVRDLTKEQAYVEDRLTASPSYYVIGSRYQQGIGYDFSFQNTSLATIPTKNTIKQLSLYTIPYDALKDLALIRTDVLQTIQASTVTAVKKSYASYSLTVTPELHGKTLILWQAYQPGWQLYATNNTLARLFPMLFGERIDTHTKVNNWANGWNLSGISEGNSLQILYLPQHLAYAGFVLLGMSGFILNSKTKYAHHESSA